VRVTTVRALAQRSAIVLANAALTEWDRAQDDVLRPAQSATSRNKAEEGVDYFATPEPLGLKMAQWADIRPGDAALEPSAGHGAIARWIREDAQRTAIEPSGELRSRLALVFGGDQTKINDGRFEDLHVVNKFDAITMNPPFGTRWPHGDRPPCQGCYASAAMAAASWR